jgi:hypothetical protein
MPFGKLGAGFGRLGRASKSSSGAPGITVPSGLVGYWTLDSTAAVDSINANNGVATNSPTVVAGQVGNALNFAGTSYVKVPNSANYNFTSGGYSYAFWIKGAAASQVSFAGILSKGEGSNDFGLSRDSSTTSLSVFHGATGIDFPLGTLGSLFNGAWTHCAITYDGTTATLYISGSSAGAITINAPTYTAAFSLYIGSARAAGVPIVAAMDNLKLWNRCITSGEVTLDRNAGLAGNQ